MLLWSTEVGCHKRALDFQHIKSCWSNTRNNGAIFLGISVLLSPPTPHAQLLSSFLSSSHLLLSHPYEFNLETLNLKKTIPGPCLHLSRSPHNSCVT